MIELDQFYKNMSIKNSCDHISGTKVRLKKRKTNENLTQLALEKISYTFYKFNRPTVLCAPEAQKGHYRL